MRNYEVARMLSEIADLTEIIGEEAFKARAYRRASESIARLPGDIAEMSREGRLMDIPGVGKNIAAKIDEFLASGTVRHLEKLRERAPHTILELLEVPGLGPRTASILLRELNIRDLAGLEAALSQGRVKGLPGIGEKKAEAMRKGVEQVKRRGTRKPLGLMWPLSERIAAMLREVPGVERVEVAGSIRRRCDTVGDIDIVAASTDRPGLVAAFTSLPGVAEVLAAGDTRASVRIHDVGRVDLLAVPPSRFTGALHHFTGSKAHNVRLREMAGGSGFKISEYGVTDAEERTREVSSEEEIYRLFNMDYVPPELRENVGEVEAALEHRLPELVEARDIRGDLHVHTDWSDGSAGVAEMALAAKELGYEYIAVSDHSKSLGVAGGLDAERIRQQADEIRRVNEGLDGFRVLAGVEVDITKNGDLDLDDETLSHLDIVTASVHSAFNLDEDAMTARLEKAMKNPHVDVIAHPTGRLIGRREPYSVDLERLIEVAARTGTFLEINSSPDRLDLSDRWARRAMEAGCRLVVNTDAHAPVCLRDVEYGVAVARRAWATRDNIVNTLSLDDLLKALE